MRRLTRRRSRLVTFTMMITTVMMAMGMTKMMARRLTMTMMNMKMGTLEMTMIFEERNSSYGERTAAHGDSTKESQVIINNPFLCSSLFSSFQCGAGVRAG